MNDPRTPKEDVALLEWRRIHFRSLRRQVVPNLICEVLENSERDRARVIEICILVVGSVWYEAMSSWVDVEADALGENILERHPPCDQVPIWARIQITPILVGLGGRMIKEHRLVQCEVNWLSANE